MFLIFASWFRAVSELHQVTANANLLSLICIQLPEKWSGFYSKDTQENVVFLLEISAGYRTSQVLHIAEATTVCC